MDNKTPFVKGKIHDTAKSPDDAEGVDIPKESKEKLFTEINMDNDYSEESSW